jgi:hypothetical protein
MTYIIAVLGFVLLSAALWDAFEVIISPRRVTSRFRLARAFYRSSWWLWSAVGRSISDENRRETYLGIFGPSLWLCCWGCGQRRSSWVSP